MALINNTALQAQVSNVWLHLFIQSIHVDRIELVPDRCDWQFKMSLIETKCT